MKIWLHVHSTHSYDGTCSLADIANAARQAEVAVVCMAEHSDRWSAEGYVLFREECRHVSVETGVLLIPGIEVTADNGWHVLCFGASSWIEPLRPPTAIVSDAKHFAAVVGLAHPRTDAFGRIAGLPLDFVEVWNLKRDRLVPRSEHARLARSMGLRAIAGLDAHGCHDLRMVCVELDAAVIDEAAVLDALRSGQYIVRGAGWEVRPEGVVTARSMAAWGAVIRANTRRVLKILGSPMRNWCPQIHRAAKSALDRRL